HGESAWHRVGAYPADMRARPGASTGGSRLGGRQAPLFAADHLHLGFLPRAGDLVGLGTDLPKRLLQHRVGGRADRRADRTASDRAHSGQQVAGLGQHLDRLVEGLFAQVGRATDVDLRRRAVDLQVVAARAAPVEADAALDVVEREPFREEIAEIQRQPTRQLGDAQQAEHAARARLHLEQPAIACGEGQVAVQYADVERGRAAGPARVEPYLSMATGQPSAVAQAGQQAPEVFAVDLRGEVGQLAAAVAQPAAAEFDQLLAV